MAVRKNATHNPFFGQQETNSKNEKRNKDSAIYYIYHIYIYKIVNNTGKQIIYSYYSHIITPYLT